MKSKKVVPKKIILDTSLKRYQLALSEMKKNHSEWISFTDCTLILDKYKIKENILLILVNTGYVYQLGDGYQIITNQIAKLSKICRLRIIHNKKQLELNRIQNENLKKIRKEQEAKDRLKTFDITTKSDIFLINELKRRGFEVSKMVMTLKNY